MGKEGLVGRNSKVKSVKGRISGEVLKGVECARQDYWCGIHSCLLFIVVFVVCFSLVSRFLFFFSFFFFFCFFFSSFFFFFFFLFFFFFNSFFLFLV